MEYCEKCEQRIVSCYEYSKALNLTETRKYLFSPLSGFIRIIEKLGLSHVRYNYVYVCMACTVPAIVMCKLINGG